MMAWDAEFFLHGILLGVGLAMDAFSASLANGLYEPFMRRRRIYAIAGVYGGFQALMPMTGWALVHTAATRLRWMQAWIPWIGAALLAWIGWNMLTEEREEEQTAVSLLAQGIATSLDALWTGFALASYDTAAVLVTSGIIAAVTFCLCAAGIILGRRFGLSLARRASILGGVILLGIAARMLLSLTQS